MGGSSRTALLSRYALPSPQVQGGVLVSRTFPQVFSDSHDAARAQYVVRVLLAEQGAISLLSCIHGKP